MALIKFTRFKPYLTELGQGAPIPGVFLVHGENYIVRQITDRLTKFLQERQAGAFALEKLEGGSIRMGDVIEEITTLSFLSPKKIVVLKQAPLFTSGEKGVDIGFSAADIDHLADVIEKGLPENHFFIITTSTSDKRKKIYKTIEKKGCCIDCTVAQGLRKADQDEQNKILLGVANQILAKSGKTIDRQGFALLVGQTGFNLDILQQNLDKLIAYTGTRTTIGPADVKAVVQREKKDPIFNLTNALMDKDVTKSIFYFNSLINEGYHPLQILKSFENQVRKLLVVKTFTVPLRKSMPNGLAGMNFNQFKQLVLPKAVQEDLKTTALIDEQEKVFSKDAAKKKKPNFNDLLLAPNPKNPYPVYQIFQKSEKFSLKELQDMIAFLSDLDLRLKSSSFEVNVVIEHFIINVCSQGGFRYAAENQDRRNRF